MIDHVNIPISDLARARAIYEPMLSILGMRCLVEEEDALGFGKTHWAFGLIAEEAQIVPLHLAFRATTHEQVKAFHSEGLKQGCQCNGAPGFRPEYGEGYFAAYLRDPDGHNIEALCRG